MADQKDHPDHRAHEVNPQGEVLREFQPNRITNIADLPALEDVANRRLRFMHNYRLRRPLWDWSRLYVQRYRERQKYSNRISMVDLSNVPSRDTIATRRRRMIAEAHTHVDPAARARFLQLNTEQLHVRNLRKKLKDLLKTLSEQLPALEEARKRLHEAQHQAIVDALTRGIVNSATRNLQLERGQITLARWADTILSERTVTPGTVRLYEIAFKAAERRYTATFKEMCNTKIELNTIAKATAGNRPIHRLPRRRVVGRSSLATTQSTHST
jgi:hypothetical protein